MALGGGPELWQHMEQRSWSLFRGWKLESILYSCVTYHMRIMVRKKKRDLAGDEGAIVKNEPIEHFNSRICFPYEFSDDKVFVTVFQVVQYDFWPSAFIQRRSKTIKETDECGSPSDTLHELLSLAKRLLGKHSIIFSQAPQMFNPTFLQLAASSEHTCALIRTSHWSIWGFLAKERQREEGRGGEGEVGGNTA